MCHEAAQDKVAETHQRLRNHLQAGYDMLGGMTHPCSKAACLKTCLWDCSAAKGMTHPSPTQKMLLHSSCSVPRALDADAAVRELCMLRKAGYALRLHQRGMTLPSVKLEKPADYPEACCRGGQGMKDACRRSGTRNASLGLTYGGGGGGSACSTSGTEGNASF